MRSDPLFGIPGVDLMERAGQHCAETVVALFAAHARRKALVVAVRGITAVMGMLLPAAAWTWLADRCYGSRPK